MKLVLLAGQSNSAGQTFGRLLRAFAPDDEVRLVPVAVVGASVSSWLPGGVSPRAPARHPYDDAIARARAARSNGDIVAILWQQDGMDATLETPDYEPMLRGVVENFRRDLGLAQTVPFIVGTFASFIDASSSCRVSDGSGIDAVLERLARTVPWFGVVSARDLPGKDFGAGAQEALGERFFRMWKAMSAVCPEKQVVQAAKYRDAPRVRSCILLDPGEFLVTSPFGCRIHPVTGEPESFHSGIDGALWNGRMLLETGICAWRDGVVSTAADSNGPAGTCVAIDHGDGLVSRYFHLEHGSLRVARGDRVRAGSLLGWMGKTGRATGEHLHFQVEQDAIPVNPMPLLRD